MRQIIIEQAGDLAIDGEAKPGGKYHYMVYSNDDLICGGYINKSEIEGTIDRYLNGDYNGIEDL
jgi:hypothetical protein